MYSQVFGLRSWTTTRVCTSMINIFLVEFRLLARCVIPYDVIQLLYALNAVSRLIYAHVSHLMVRVRYYFCRGDSTKRKHGFENILFRLSRTCVLVSDESRIVYDFKSR